MTLLYRGHDHCNRLWTVTVDISHPKDPPSSIRVWFHADVADGSRSHVDSTSLWTPGSGWRGPWTPTKPRAVPPAVREAVEAALQRQGVA